MHTKHRAVFAVALFCVAGLPLAASANTSAFTPLMPTKDPVAHQVPMQSYAAADKVSSSGAGTVIMTPLMPTKDRIAHRAGGMQVFSWFQPYGAKSSGRRSDDGVDAPLMPTKDPEAHRG